jgi:hypothetical protein
MKSKMFDELFCPAFLLSPSNAILTITNVLAGVRFGNRTFNVSECAVEAVIPVVLTGVTNNLVGVVCSTVSGGGQPRNQLRPEFGHWPAFAEQGGLDQPAPADLRSGQPQLPSLFDCGVTAKIGLTKFNHRKLRSC